MKSPRPAAVLAAIALTLAPIAVPAAEEPAAVPAVTPAPDPAAPLLQVTNPPAAPAVPGDPGQAFAVGVAAYDKGDFAAARTAFATAERTAVSPALEYNLGNACFETGDPAAAVLHYLRALTLQPRNPDARANLAFARQALGIVAPEPIWREHLLAWMSVNAWIWVAAAAGWAALYLLFLPRLFRWRGVLPWTLCLLTLLLTATAATALWTAREHARDGVVLRDDTQVRISPTTDGQAVGVLQAGELAETIERHGDYFRVRAPAGQTGWVSAQSFAPVWE